MNYVFGTCHALALSPIRCLRHSFFCSVDIPGTQAQAHKQCGPGQISRRIIKPKSKFCVFLSAQSSRQLRRNTYNRICSFISFYFILFCGCCTGRHGTVDVDAAAAATCRSLQINRQRQHTHQKQQHQLQQAHMHWRLLLTNDKIPIIVSTRIVVAGGVVNRRLHCI